MNGRDLTVRVPSGLYARLQAAALDYDTSVSLIAVAAFTEFVDGLQPTDERITP